MEIVHDQDDSDTAAIFRRRAQLVLTLNHGTLHDSRTEFTTRRLITKSKTTGSVMDQTTLLHHRNARSIENIAAIRDNVRANPRRSIPRCAQELEITAASMTTNSASGLESSPI